MTTSPDRRDDDVARDSLERWLLEQRVPDALMLRRVLRLREYVQELDRELHVLREYFIAG